MSNERYQLPKAWRWGKLGELAAGIRGVSYRPEHLCERSSSDTVTLLRSTNIQGGTLDLADLQHVSKGIVGAHQLAEPKDLAVCMSNGSKALVGKSAQFDETARKRRMTVGAFCSIFRAREGVYPDFVRQIFAGPDFQSQVDLTLAGSAINNLRNKVLEDFEVPLPPQEEQRRIAAVLAALDEQIEKTEAWIAKQQLILDGLIDELLISPIREEKLSHYAEIGPRTDVSQVTDKVPFLPMDAVSEEGQVSRVETKPWSSVSTGFTRFAGGDVLVAKITPCFENGKGAQVPNSAAVWAGSTEFHVIRAKPGVSERWVYWYTRAREFREKGAMQMTGSAGQQRVPRSFLEAFPVRKISEKEQASLASTLDSVQEELVSERRLLSKLRLNKRGLMCDLLTGKVRVPTRDAA